MFNKTSTVSIMLIGLYILVLINLYMTKKNGAQTTSGYSKAIGLKLK